MSMSGDGQHLDTLQTLLGHMSADELSIASTRRVEPGDTQTDLPPEFEVPVLDGENRLELGETIGKGGAGIVQLGVQRSLDRQVAVKRLRPDRMAPGAEVGLWREAWIGGLLAHPNIVAIYDLDVDDTGLPAIVCQHVDGEPWTASLKADFEANSLLHPETLERHLRVLMDVCDAVAFAHHRGFLHRDLKPDNVMLGKFGEVYLIDWGIAMALDGRHGNRFPVATDVQSISGTPCYMAPELIRDQDDDALYVGIPTDVYLLGGVLFQILCGRAPHMVGRLDEMLESIRISQFEFPPQVPKEIAAICAKALSREPAARYQTATELKVAIANFLAQQRARAVLYGANKKLHELTTLAGDESLGGSARFQLYRLFSECKFGYGSIADVLPAEARQGITVAAEEMVAFELDRGDPDAAEALLAEVGEVSDAVIASIAQARQLKHAELETLKNYAAVGRSHDVRRGLQSRFLLGCLGVLLIFTGPFARLLMHWRGSEINLFQQLITGGLTVLAFGGIAWFFRKDLRTHAVTRAAAMTCIAVGITHVFLGATAYLTHFDLGLLRIVNCYVIATGCVLFGLLFERGMLWSGVAFFAGGTVIATNPDDLVMRNILVVACGVFFALNALVVWGPRARAVFEGTRNPHRP